MKRKFRIAVVYALAVFMIAANARALVPGMCATLAQINSGELCVLDSTSGSSCCPPLSSKSSEGVSASVDANQCAFCYLTHSLVNQPAAPPAETPNAQAEGALLTACDAPKSPAVWNPISHRGPPVRA